MPYKAWIPLKHTIPSRYYGIEGKDPNRTLELVRVSEMEIHSRLHRGKW